MRGLLLSLTLVAAGCGGSPVSPSPSPTTWTGPVTDTVSGATLADVTRQITSGRVFLTAPGYLDRDVRVTSAAADLIPQAGFDLDFYREFARDAADGPLQPLQVLSAAPAIYLETDGLSDADVAALEATARAVVPALTGGRFQVSGWDTGAGTRPVRAGWITITTTTDPAVPCGSTEVGATLGRMVLNTAARCAFNERTVDPPLFAHELGHALGFFHVSAPGHLMHPRATFADRTTIEPSDRERYHAAIAYRRPAGNRDPDVDP